MSPTPWPQARERAWAAAPPLPAQTVPLLAAHDATLAAPLVAAVDLPGFDAAAMDGYAVGGAGPWQVRERVLAGAPQPAPLRAGEAVEVATGAAVPPGTVGVLPYEQAQVAGGTVTVAGGTATVATGTVTVAGGDPARRDAVPERHVRRAGETCRRGDALLAAGTPITPAVLGLAASVGLDVLDVRPRPRVVALITGDEIVTAGAPGPGRVRDAVGPMLPGVLSALHADLVRCATVPDDAAAVRTAVATADADVVLTVGMSARGPADFLRAVLAGLGATAVVDGVAVKPGGPQSLALLPDGRLVAGLPGNPLAALAGVVTLLAPLLARLGGRALVPLSQARVRGRGSGTVSGPQVPVETHATRLVVVRRNPDGTVTPTGHDRPALLLGAAMGDAFAAVPPGWDGRSPVAVVPIPGAGPARG